MNKLINEQFDVFIQSNSIKVNTLGGVVLFILLVIGIGLLIFCKRFSSMINIITFTNDYLRKKCWKRNRNNHGKVFSEDMEPQSRSSSKPMYSPPLPPPKPIRNKPPLAPQLERKWPLPPPSVQTPPHILRDTHLV